MSEGDRSDARFRVLSVRTIWWAAVMIVVVGFGAAVWLLVAFGGGGDQQRNQLEAVKAAGTLLVLAGGGAALILAARRQRSTEIALQQKDRDQALQERVAAATESDATARRITELYTRAVEQVGSDKAPVRLGGLYALERLAQDNENQRQTIANVLCAYLRMPYVPPGEQPDATVSDTAITEYRERAQEREVRMTAQRLLLEHLQPGDDPDNPVQAFWKDVNLDLTGSVLIEFNLRNCRLGSAIFRSATFSGPFADFTSTTFSADAAFDRAIFEGLAVFNSANFCQGASFWHGTFGDRAEFGSNFADDVVFGGAEFAKSAHFGGAVFKKDVYLGSATFHDYAIFSTSSFGGRVYVSRTTSFAHGHPREIAPFLSDDDPGARG